jgi:membrane protein implicated in regulation of membrane protease activity
MKPLVALFAVGVSAIVVILVFVPADDTTSRAVVLAILAIIGPLMSADYIRKTLGKRVDKVQEDVAVVRERQEAQAESDEQES